MAAGIVVRSIAPLLKDKATDPCVLVLDQHGRHVVSLLSGHLGGGNALAHEVAAITRGVAVITTASDNLGRTALDLWARRNRLVITDRPGFTTVTARLIDRGQVFIFRAGGLPGLPEDLQPAASPADADILITFKKNMTFDALCCISKTLYVGVGCNRGAGLGDISAAFFELCDEHGISAEAVAGIATIDVKSDEAGILEFADSIGVDVSFFTRDQLNGVPDVSSSAAVMKAVGAKGVAEPAALLAASSDNSTARLMVVKQKWKDVTLAVAERIRERWE